MCHCWERVNKELEESWGLQISPACESMRLEKKILKFFAGLPLVTMAGKKPTGKKPKMIGMTHCPFCGKKME